MSKARSLLFLLGCVPAACGVVTAPTPVDSAHVRPGVFGSTGDNDLAGIGLAAWAFAEPNRTHGRPADAALAAASLEYAAGELSTSPRWDKISSNTKQQMLRARLDLRRVLGVAPGATSQEVVDALLGASGALRAGDTDAAEAALSPPVFIGSGAETLQALNDLPYLQVANVATSAAQLQTYGVNPSDGQRGR
jgi:hypothetical protein